MLYKHLICVLQLSRNQRFSASFHHTVETLVNMMMPHITQKYKDNLDAARNANHSLAVFIKVHCVTLCFVFPTIVVCVRILTQFLSDWFCSAAST